MSQESSRGMKRRFDGFDRNQEIVPLSQVFDGDSSKDQIVSDGQLITSFLQPISPPMQHGYSSLQTSSKTSLPSFAESRASRRLPLPSPIKSSSYPSRPPFAPSPETEHYTSYQSSGHANRDNFGLQAMRSDHVGLNAIYPGSPTKSEEIDQNSDRTTSELVNTVREKQRLQHRIQFLESQVKDLQNNIEALQKHAAAKDSQYTQIIRHSTELESRGAADSKLWKADREVWSQERQGLDRMIVALRSQLEATHSASSGDTGILLGQAEDKIEDDDYNDSYSSSVLEVSASAKPGSSGGTRVVLKLDEFERDCDQLAQYATKLVDLSQQIRHRGQGCMVK